MSGRWFDPPNTGPAKGVSVGEPIRSRPEAETSCHETGGQCQHNCRDKGIRGCWKRHARLACEPEGRDTGLHRDSMG